MAAASEVTRVPISALRQATMAVLSSGLNRHKIIPNDDGLPRDWRGLAHLIGLNGVETSKVAFSNDPMAELIKTSASQVTVQQLQHFLAVIDRFDVLDDAKELIDKDVEVFFNRASIPTRSNVVNNAGDSDILTVDDVVRLEQGLNPQIYDGYLLFAEEDIDFASKIVDTMEQQYNLKLCIRDRDLVGGITFEHEAIMKLIAERCRRLLVVVTPSFLKSSANKFFVTFAQALGIDQRQRKVIPILYEKCELPPELSYYFLLDYTRSGVLWNFWEKLRDSIQTSDVGQTAVTQSSPWMSKSRLETAKVVTPEEKTALELKSAEKGVSQQTPKSLESGRKPVLKYLSSSITNLVSTNKEKKRIDREEKSGSSKQFKKLFTKNKSKKQKEALVS